MRTYFWQSALILISLLVVMVVGLGGAASRFDQLFYNYLEAHVERVVLDSDSVVLIDIDEETLAQFSRWPLPRNVHARAIDLLHQSQTSSVTYNLAFVSQNQNYSESDLALAGAVERNGKVVLPIVAEQGVELPPLGDTQLKGAVIGHADLSPDDDRFLRRSYLYAGIAFPRWPSLALATLKTFAPVKADDFSGLRSPYLHLAFLGQWNRDYELYLPFGLKVFRDEIERYSLLDLLEGKIDPKRLKNKAVFVGIQHSALEPLVQVGSERYTSTEIHSFLFSALNRGYTLTPSLPLWSMVLGIVVTLILAIAWFVSAVPVWLKVGLSIMAILFATMPWWLLLAGYWLSVLPVAVGVIVVTLLTIVRRFFVRS